MLVPTMPANYKLQTLGHPILQAMLAGLRSCSLAVGRTALRNLHNINHLYTKTQSCTSHSTIASVVANTK